MRNLTRKEILMHTEIIGTHDPVAAQIGKQLSGAMCLMEAAAAELTLIADAIKRSGTVCGEWDGTDLEAEVEYSRLMGLAKCLAPDQ